MDDLISRQAAIDALEEPCKVPDTWSDEYAVGERMQWEKDVKALKDLPSAQPEIIRCKDCRWGREVCGNIECFVDSNIPPEYHGYEWFCPNGERKEE